MDEDSPLLRLEEQRVDPPSRQEVVPCSPSELYHQSPAEIKAALERAAVLLEDGIAGRSIYHKMDLNSLFFYHVYYSVYYQIMFYVMIGLYLLLPLFETPSVYNVNYRFVILTEILCLLTFSFDLFLKIRIAVCKTAFLNDTVWHRIYVVVLLLSFSELLLSFIVTFPFSLRKILRPFFLAQNSSLMKKTLKNMISTVPEIAAVLGLITFHITFFALIGMLLFSHTPEGDERFSSIWVSFRELFILLTTANHPSIMMLAYSENRWYCLYFIVFLLVGLYCFKNILTAIIYTSFKGNLTQSMQTRLNRRYIAFRGAFEVLASSQNLCRVPIDTDQPPTGSGQIRDRCRTVSSALLVETIKMVSNMDKEVVSALHDKLKCLGMGNGGELRDGNMCINFEEFYKLFEITAYKSTFVAKINDTLPGYNSEGQILSIIKSIASHKHFELLVNGVVIANMIVIAFELNVHSTVAFVKLTSGMFLLFYAVETSLRFVSIGLKGYLKADAWVEFDMFAAFVNVLFGVYVILIDNSSYETGSIGAEVGYLKTLNILFLVRSLRVVFFIKAFDNILKTVFTLIKSISTLAGVLILTYYIFAVIGMQLFAGKVYEGNPVLNGTSFDQMNYWANNFDNFPSSLVTLWELMVVNDWYVIMEAHVLVTSNFASLFFIAWYIISVVMLMNLVVALTLESFLRKYRLRKEKRKTFSGFESLVEKTEYFHAADMLLDMFKNELVPPSEECIRLALAKHVDIDFRYLVEERSFGYSSSVDFGHM